jgi:hypothetical protein
MLHERREELLKREALRRASVEGLEEPESSKEYVSDMELFKKMGIDPHRA